MKFVKLALVSCVMIGLITVSCWAATSQDQVVPTDAKSAKDVVGNLQQKGTTNIRSIEFDNNQWNVKTQHNQKETHYQIDAKTGNVTKQQEQSEYESAPSSNVLGIIEVINTVEKQGLKGIREIEYDDSLWKVEVIQDGKITKLCIDPIAGDIIWQDVKPFKASSNGNGNGSTSSSTKTKINQIKDVIKGRFLNGKSTQTQKQPSSSTSNQLWQSKSTNGTSKNGTSKNGTSKNGSSTSGSKTYQPW